MQTRQTGQGACRVHHLDQRTVLTSLACRAVLVIRPFICQKKGDTSTFATLEKRRRQVQIMNTTQSEMSNTKIAGTNNKIKMIIGKGYSFRNVQKPIDMAFLV